MKNSWNKEMCKIVISFRIDSFPEKTESYHVPAYTEGNLTIEIDSEIVFNRNEILLVELSNAIESWLAKEPESFLYNSMNYEESPIIAFNMLTDQTLAFESCWKMTNATHVLTIDELKTAFNQFVTQIRLEVKARS